MSKARELGTYAGKILQVKSTIKTDTFTTTSGSVTDITGLSVAITPASTSIDWFVEEKFFIFC